MAAGWPSRLALHGARWRQSLDELAAQAHGIHSLAGPGPTVQSVLRVYANLKPCGTS